MINIRFLLFSLKHSSLMDAKRKVFDVFTKAEQTV